MEYATSDIVLAAYLKTCGVNMIRIDKVGHKGTFIFSDDAFAHLTTYDTGNAQVEPISFNNTVRQLTTACRR